MVTKPLADRLSAIWADRASVPYEVEDEDWQERVEELTTLIDESNDSAVLAWFDRWVPRCMALIPRRRRAAFLAGVYEFVEEGGEIEF